MKEEDKKTDTEKTEAPFKKEFSYGFGSVVVIVISTMNPTLATVTHCFGPCTSGVHT